MMMMMALIMMKTSLLQQPCYRPLADDFLRILRHAVTRALAGIA